ncbi:MAG: CoA ester lyase [Alphaproteobacteria bacterium]|nr:CoA ester lyase [Alphaproteobacteria bacterium]
MSAARARRSVLYRLGTDPFSYAGARYLAVDVLLFDLEDSVSPADKADARARLAAAIAKGGFAGQELLVRINGLDTPWGEDDAKAVAGLAVDGVMLAKAEDAESMRALDKALSRAGAPAAMGLWAMVETPRGVLAADAIAGACRRMAGLAIGLGDLSRGMGGFRRAAPFRFPVLAALSTVLLAARAHGLAAIDSSFRDARDPAGFRAACLESRELGYDGKALSDPALAPIADDAFSPTAEERDWAARVLAALEASPPGILPVLDGQLVEPGYADVARRIVAAGTWRGVG